MTVKQDPFAASVELEPMGTVESPVNCGEVLGECDLLTRGRSAAIRRHGHAQRQQICREFTSHYEQIGRAMKTRLTKATQSSSRKSRLAVAAAMAGVLLSGCGSSSSDADGSGDSSDSAKPLKMATDLAAPPHAFEKDGKPAGFEIDLARAIAKEMGRKLEVTNVGWSSMITGVKSKRFDFSSAGMADTTERQREVDFVDFAVQLPDQLLVKSGNPSGIAADAMCGHSVALITGSLEEGYTKYLSKQCAAEGKQALKTETFSDLDSIMLAVKNGRIDATLLEPAFGDLVASKDGSGLELLEGAAPGFPPLTLGMAVVKGSPLAEQMRGALQAIIDDGTYADVLESYDVAGYGIDKATVNNATAPVPGA